MFSRVYEWLVGDWDESGRVVVLGLVVAAIVGIMAVLR